MNKGNILQKLTCLQNQEVESFIDGLNQQNKTITIGFLNQHGFNLISRSDEVKGIFMNLNYLLRDGVGIKIACKYHGISPGENLNGTDFIPQVIGQLVHNRTDVELFAYGTEDPWVQTGGSILFCRKNFHYLHGFHPEQFYVDHFNSQKSSTSLNVVVLAMGMPKQEHVAQ